MYRDHDFRTIMNIINKVITAKFILSKSDSTGLGILCCCAGA